MHLSQCDFLPLQKRISTIKILSSLAFCIVLPQGVQKLIFRQKSNKKKNRSLCFFSDLRQT